MTKPLAAIFSAAIAVALSGCLNSTTTITVEKDGSGTIEDRSLVGAEFIEMMNQLTKGLGKLLGKESASGAPSNPILLGDDTYREKAATFGEGVSFISAREAKEADGSVGAVVRYHFDDVTTLAIRPRETMSAMDSLKSAIPIQINNQPELPGAGIGGDPITFGFEPGDIASLTINLPPLDEEKIREAAAKHSVANTPSAGNLAQARQFLGGMRFALLVVVDGEVVSSDATYGEENTATLFAMDFGKLLDDPDAFAKLQRLGEEKDFDKARAALQDVEGMKFETKERVEIRFK